MVLRARKVSGAFEKLAPGVINDLYILLSIHLAQERSNTFFSVILQREFGVSSVTNRPSVELVEMRFA